MRQAALFLVCLTIVNTARPASLESYRAFQKAAVVLRHPRCINCHIPGDSPLLSANRQRHPMLVERGPDGQGSPVMRCTACHQDVNGILPHSPPGSKDWKLPPPQSRMAWVGLDDRRLCNALLDPKINGGMKVKQLVDHVTADPRVLWAWNPGPGRDSPPLKHAEFVELIRIWIEKGAACAP